MDTATPSRSIRIIHSGLRGNIRRHSCHSFPSDFHPEVMYLPTLTISHRSQSRGLTMRCPFRHHSHKHERTFVFWRITRQLCVFLARFKRSCSLIRQTIGPVTRGGDPTASHFHANHCMSSQMVCLRSADSYKYAQGELEPIDPADLSTSLLPSPHCHGKSYGMLLHT